MLTQPDSWKTPIDYTQGTIYIEQDVLTKPSAEETQVDICFLTGGYGCLNTNHYTATGRNTTMNPVTDFWQFEQIDWAKKIALVQLIVKDKNNANGGRPVEKFMPTRMHIALTVVAKGSTYTPPPGFGGAAVPDAGAPADADVPADAADPGAGGAPGSGGSDGAGGTTGRGGRDGSGGTMSGATGGATGSGGAPSAGGKGGSASGGKPGGGKGGSASTDQPVDEGTPAAKSGACALAPRADGSGGALALLGLAASALVLTRRRRR
jgi:hypothetical protein